MKRFRRLAAHGTLAFPLLTVALAVAAQAEESKVSTSPAVESASKPRTATTKDASDNPVLWDRLDPQAIGRAASRPGTKRRVFPAE